MSENASDLTKQLQATHDDPPPAALLAAARAAYSWRTLDTDLCRPSYDSLLDEALTAVRGGQLDARLLTFHNDDLTLDVEVTTDGKLRALVGQLTPAGAAELTVRQGTGEEISVTADGDGRFLLDGVQAGPMSIRCAMPSQSSTLYTDWLLV